MILYEGHEKNLQNTIISPSFLPFSLHF